MPDEKDRQAGQDSAQILLDNSSESGSIKDCPRSATGSLQQEVGTGADLADQKHEQGQDNSLEVQQDHAQQLGTGEGITNLEQALAKIQALSLQIQDRDNTILDRDSKLKERDNTILSLESRLESFELGQTCPWGKLFNMDGNSEHVSKVSQDVRKGIRTKCNEKCQASGIIGGTNICAHIWPKHCGAELRSIFGNKYRINGYRNLALFHEDVEKAFDSGKMCFVSEFKESIEAKIIRPKILDKSIGDIRIGNSDVTFNDLERGMIDMNDHVVSGTLLSQHSKHAIHHAYVKDWIKSPDKQDLLQQAEYDSPECAKAQRIVNWLRSQVPVDGSFPAPAPGLPRVLSPPALQARPSRRTCAALSTHCQVREVLDCQVREVLDCQVREVLDCQVKEVLDCQVRVVLDCQVREVLDCQRCHYTGCTGKLKGSVNSRLGCGGGGDGGCAGRRRHRLEPHQRGLRRLER